MREQQVLSPRDNYIELDKYLQAAGATHIFLVCGSSIRSLALEGYFQTLARRTGIQVTRFSGFQPNPDYESVMVGNDRLRLNECDLIAAVGGGSARHRRGEMHQEPCWKPGASAGHSNHGGERQ